MFTIGLPFRGRPLPRRPWKLVQTSLKVKKVGRQAVSGRIFLLRSVFCPKTFSLSRLYNGRRRQRKQATDGKVGTKEKQHTISRLLPVHMLSWNSTGGIFFESWMKRAGGKLRSLQKNQSVFFRSLANIRLCPVRCALSLCRDSVRLSAFLQRCSAKAVALGVLSLESIVMIFSLLFISSSLLSMSSYFLSFSYSFSPLL